MYVCMFVHMFRRLRLSAM